MKKLLSVLVIVGVVFLIVFIYGIILEPELGKIEEDFEKAGYFVINHHNMAYEITDKEVINAIILELSGLEVKKRHPYKEFIADINILYGSNKNAYYLNGYTSQRDKNELFELTVRSNDYIYLNDDEYRIKTDTCIYDILELYTITRNSVGLPDIVKDNIAEFSLQGGLEYTKEEIGKKYEKVRKSKLITKEEFEYSDRYISFKTFDEEFIDMYFVGDRIFTRYRKDKLEIESLKRVKDKYGDIISEWKIDCYYVLE